ncbi:fused MFS/spermidine synthase [Ideonella sp. 4Y11]|uniref:Fused MFS/spermidine synthase n=1 Tax=Ideonella aquatica TaxID=2824119 RepID=A0A940YS58_9BURK|nr:fused MFS/spermidine synthase [Ideonella aquatica]MBQ0958405.1 fused MFS/spermidine synthase [Ideonella aquatica]
MSEAWWALPEPAEPDQVQPFLVRDGEHLSLHFHLGEVQSSMRSDDPQRLALDYTRTMAAALLLAPAPRTVLMIGLGGGSLLKFLRAQLPAATLTVVEINPHVIALRDAFAIPRDDEQLCVLCADGAAHVASTSAQYDLLLVDGFDYDGQPEALCSPDFYAHCRERLAPGGLLVVNLHADGDQEHRLLDRLALCFDGQLVAVPSADAGNRIVFAGAPCQPGRDLGAVRRRWAGMPAGQRETLAHVHPVLMQALMAQGAA